MFELGRNGDGGRLTAAFVALWMSTSMPVAAAELDLRPDSPIVRYFLPYAPFAFDLAVQAGRGFGEITYGERHYDPITESFVVSDFHIRRDAFDMTLRRLRLGQSTLSLEGIAVDTRGLPLDPPMRDALKQLDSETVTGTLALSVVRDDARSAFATNMALDLDNIGALSVQAEIDNFHLLVPLGEIVEGSETLSNDPKLSGSLNSARIAYADHGLINVVSAIAAQGQGVTPGQLREGIAVMPTMSVDQWLATLPGGATPALREKALGWARTLEGFIRKPDSIALTLYPEEPVALARLQTGVVDEALLNDLNPSLSTGEDVLAVASAADDSTPVGAAAALAVGDSVPQNRDAAAKTLLSLASSGDEEAVLTLASLFGAGTPPAFETSDLALLYQYLIVGKALGASVSEASLTALVKVIPATNLRGAEIAAGAFFRDKTEAGKERPALTAETITGYSASGLRILAFDFYEGIDVPRDLTEAYAVALVAAAAGDPQAPSLRDSLGAAAQDKRIVVSMDEARARAAALWAAYSKPATP